jgi:hypothetical protein
MTESIPTYDDALNLAEQCTFLSNRDEVLAALRAREPYSASVALAALEDFDSGGQADEISVCFAPGEANTIVMFSRLQQMLKTIAAANGLPPS